MTKPIRKFQGKKLLLLGTNSGTCDIVNYARSQGAYVIVTDNLSPEKSAAKLIADEAWPVSTADVDTLEKLAINNKVNGVFAGVSEFNLEKALTLCERLGFPFYSTRKHWEMLTNKQRFKRLCRDNGVPVAREYILDAEDKSDLGQIQYPVIVKPVDSSGGIGIRICQNENELLKAYIKAVSFSKTKRAIVEQCIQGDEFSAGYTIKDSQFSLTYLADRYVTEPSETIPLPQANLLPSKYADKYLAELNAKVIQLFKSIGLSNGFIFVQGTRDNNGFYIFEANYRIDAFLMHRFTGRINGIDYLEMLVNYALTGGTNGYDLSLDNPKINKYCCVLSGVSKGGLVGKIFGSEEIKHKQSLIAVEKMYDVGDYIEKSGTLRQVHFKFFLIEDTIQELRSSIHEIQDTVKVLDDKGEDMLLAPFDTSVI
jgi:biotin carboxylase